MAKNNNLTDFLTDVANAIREKKGTSALIDPQDFSDEIASISGETDLTETELIVGQIEEAVGEYSSAEEPLSATYFNITNGEIRGFSSLGQTAYANGEITALVLPSEDDSSNLITSIGEQAFFNCSSLISVIIGSSVTSIGYIAFGECIGLTSITIPDSVESIGSLAFFECSSLTSITIPSGVTSIGAEAFFGCSGLTSVTVEATTPPTLGTNVFDNTNNCPIYVPAESVSAYQTAWSAYASRIQAEVE